MAESNPSPLVAEVLKIWNVRFLRASSPNAWWTSATLRDPSMSCLLASTTNIAPCSSSSYNSQVNTWILPESFVILTTTEPVKIL